MGFKNLDSGFGGAHPPLLHPTVTDTTVSNATVSNATVSDTTVSDMTVDSMTVVFRICQLHIPPRLPLDLTPE